MPLISENQPIPIGKLGIPKPSLRVRGKQPESLRTLWTHFKGRPIGMLVHIK